MGKNYNNDIAASLPAIGKSVERPCKICGAKAPVFGWDDFNRYCMNEAERVLPPTNIPVSYNRCEVCGFLFCAAFDEWSHDDFKRHIYNADYALIDPDYESIRPRSHLTWLETLFGNSRGISILDYGGGNGLTADLARKAGFTNCAAYDPFMPEFAQRPAGTFNLITCFETIEHVPDPVKTIEELSIFAGEDGVIFFSTLLQPNDIETIGLNCWYVGPRNGHISLFSYASLKSAFGRFGYKIGFFDHNRIIAHRKIPAFMAHLPGIDLEYTVQ